MRARVWMVVVTLLGLSLGDRVCAAPEWVQQPARLATVRDGLGNVFAKLRAGQEVRIAYFGGSITAADGWRVKTLQWFRDRYPAATITEINAAIGGTGSDLGVYRFRQDVLSKSPDLVFVEFAVNDEGAEPIQIWRAMEGIIRQAWRQDPSIDICYVYTMVTDFAADYDKGLFPRATSADEMLAAYYGVPSISVAYPTAEMARAGRLWFSPKRDAEGNEISPPDGVVIWSDDNVHPRDAGHAIYAQTIQDQLATWESAARAEPHELKPPFVADNWESARLVPLAPAMLTPGWKVMSTTEGLGAAFHDRMPTMWSADAPGERIQFRFRGTAVGLYDLLGPDGARAIITLDGEPRAVDRFDWFCTYHRLAPLHIASGLSDAVHEVTVEIAPEQPDRTPVTDRVKDEAGYDPKRYDGTRMWVGGVLLIGELVD